MHNGSMRVTFDPEANLAYISLQSPEASVGEAVRQISVAEPEVPRVASCVIWIGTDG
jgi:hypothetical protein